ncbi:RidA family protein [Nonomuraea sp. NPDC048826]|uniref:RidA family protein n=1 Tax=Nonomuraea sp. NPDC048826 TaxID=3364347 RepID=UPI003722E3ED
MARRVVNPTAALTFPGMSQLVVDDDLAFLSGQCALDLAGRLVGEGDPEAQVRQAFANVESLLRAGGFALADVVKIICYVTDPDVYRAYAAVKAELFPDGGPAATTVVVAGLLDPRMLVEIDVIARHRES